MEREDGVAIPKESLDIAFLTNVLVQSDKVYEILEQISKLLKNKARFVIVDWVKKGLSFGPDHNRFVNFEEVTEWFKKKGFVLQESFEAGKYHQGLVFYKNE